jgi:WhiB family redox-sensing transcriptional regulator
MHLNPTHLYQIFINKVLEHGKVPCQEAPDLFDLDEINKNGELDYQIRSCKMLCQKCPVQRECAEYAIVAKEQYGIWGGTTPRERNTGK